MSLLQFNEGVVLSILQNGQKNTICLCCLSTNTKEMHNLFMSDHSSNNKRLSCDMIKFFQYYLEFGIDVNDGLPYVICNICVSRLTAAFEFRKQCEKARAILHRLLQSSDSCLLHEAIPQQENADVKKSKGDEEVTFNNGEKIINKMAIKKNHKKTNHKPKKKISKVLSNVMPPEKSAFIGDDISNNVEENCLNDLSSLQKDEYDVTVEDEEKVFEEDKLTLQNVSNVTLPAVDKSSLKTEGKKAHECTVCGNDFTSARKLRLHGQVHGKSKNLLCGVCGRSFNDSRSLREHHLSHTGHKPFQCSYCDRKFAQKKPLQYHEKTHTGERPHVCDVCGKSYIQPNNLVIHRRIHTGEKPFVCKECGKAFTNGASLTLHMPVHTGVKNYVCPTCGKRMARSGELTIHMRTHTGEKPYICRTCAKAFIKKSSLQAHMFCHTGEKKYVCPICGHRVAHAGKLTVHIRTHSNAKPYACPVCDRRFANQGYLKQHSKIHSGDRVKPFDCVLCGRAFAKNRNLVDHMRTHTGERPFVCLVCGHGFAQRSTLNFHMKCAHGEPKQDTHSKDDEQMYDDKHEKFLSRITDHPELPLRHIAESKKECTGSTIEKTERSHSHNLEQLEKYSSKISTSSQVTSVIHSNPQESTRSSSLIQSSSCEPKSAFDPRSSYDPIILSFIHYPHVQM